MGIKDTPWDGYFMLLRWFQISLIFDFPRDVWDDDPQWLTTCFKWLEATLLSRIAVAMDGQVVKCPLLTLLILMWIERITNHYKLALTQTWALNLHRFLSLSRKPRSAWNLCPTFPCRQGKLRSCNQPGMYKMSNLSPVCRGSKPETGLFEITWSWKDTILWIFGLSTWKLCFFHGVSPVFHVPEMIPSWS